MVDPHCHSAVPTRDQSRSRSWGTRRRPAAERPTADYQIVSPSYFTTLDLPVIAGRGFDDRDTSQGVAVCIVNEAFARVYFQGRSPIGQRVSLRRAASADGKPIVREIVGIARQVKARPTETSDVIQLYVPLAQDTPGDIFMMVRPASGERKPWRRRCVQRWLAWTRRNW